MKNYFALEKTRVISNVGEIPPHVGEKLVNHNLQRLEAAQMKFFRHLLGITKLDKEKNQCIRQKNGSTEHSKGNKTVPEKVATTCTEDGHKQTTKTSTTI